MKYIRHLPKFKIICDSGPGKPKAVAKIGDLLRNNKWFPRFKRWKRTAQNGVGSNNKYRNNGDSYPEMAGCLIQYKIIAAVDISVVESKLEIHCN